MEWIYALAGVAVGYFLCYLQSLGFSSQKLKFKLEMLMWHLQFFFKHKLGKFW